jgi:hypothetical protein
MIYLNNIKHKIDTREKRNRVKKLFWTPNLSRLYYDSLPMYPDPLDIQSRIYFIEGRWLWNYMPSTRTLKNIFSNLRDTEE